MDNHPRIDNSRDRFSTRLRHQTTAAARLLLMVWVFTVALPVIGAASANGLPEPQCPSLAGEQVPCPLLKEDIDDLKARLYGAELNARAAKIEVTERTQGYELRIQSYEARIGTYDARIASLESSISRWLAFAGLLGVILGLFTWKTREIVQDKAEAAADEWIKTEGHKKIENFQAELDAMASGFQSESEAKTEKKLSELEKGYELAEGLLADIRSQRDEGHEILKGLQERALDVSSLELTDLERPAMAQTAKSAADKSKEEQTWDDCVALAQDAFDREDFAEAAERFARASRLAPTDIEAVHALINQGFAFYMLGRYEGTIRIFEKVIDRYGDVRVPKIQEWVAMTLFNKGVTLRQLGRHEEAIRVHDQVIDRYRDADVPELQEWVVAALFNKGVELGQLGRHDEAISVYYQVMDRYGDAEAPELRERVAKALNNWADILRNRAKEQWRDDPEAARQILTDAMGKLNDASERRPDAPNPWGNLAYTRHLLGERGDAVRELLKKALKLGGEAFLTGIITDIETHPVPEDAAFRELLDEVWAEVQAEGEPPEGEGD